MKLMALSNFNCTCTGLEIAMSFEIVFKLDQFILHNGFLLSTVVNCDALTDPANGQVSHPGGTTFGQTATYSCNTGYTLVGDSTRTCQATGQWSGDAPICQCMLCCVCNCTCMYTAQSSNYFCSSVKLQPVAYEYISNALYRYTKIRNTHDSVSCTPILECASPLVTCLGPPN